MAFCSVGQFSFPSLFGAEAVSITAQAMEGWTSNAGYKPEAALIKEGGVTACNVTVSYTHPGHGDVVAIQVWLPTSDYNDRLVGVGGGGWVAGEIGNDVMAALASQGYAVATTNAGYEHNLYGTADDWLLKSPGNLDYPLIVNFAHRSLHDLAVIAKHLAAEAYGAAPAYSYWHGCSTGGRQGLSLAYEYPDDFDGILTSCTAINFPALMLAMYWPQFLMNQNGVYPPACEFEAITSSIVDLCDEADGVKDGIVARPDLCPFDPASLIGKPTSCKGEPAAISTDAVTVYEGMLQGPVDPQGSQLFPGTELGTAIVGYVATSNTACDDKGCSRGQPFPINNDWIRLMLKKDPSFDPATLSHAEYARLFRQSVREWGGLFNNNNTDLSEFRRRGGKLISWHSTNDEAVPVGAMRQYYDSVVAADRRANVSTEEYYRFFEAPGGTHCAAPLGVAYPSDALKALEAWVENGIEPEELPAVPVGGVMSNKPKRPLCLYPKTAVLHGAEYTCELVARGGSYRSHRHLRDEL